MVNHSMQSKECQKSDWRSHKDDCRIIQEQGKMKHTLKVHLPESTATLQKQLVQWSGRNTQLVVSVPSNVEL